MIKAIRGTNSERVMLVNRSTNIRPIISDAVREAKKLSIKNQILKKARKTTWT